VASSAAFKAALACTYRPWGWRKRLVEVLRRNLAVVDGVLARFLPGVGSRILLIADSARLEVIRVAQPLRVSGARRSASMISLAAVSTAIIRSSKSVPSSISG